jgi:hypothetical protein
MRTMYRRALVGVCSIGLLSASVASTGCAVGGGDDSVVSPRVEVIDRVQSALSMSRTERIQAVNGVYGDMCRDRWGQHWSVAVNGSTYLKYPALSVVKNDSECTLTLTEVVLDDDSYVAAPSLNMTTSYASSPSTFRHGDHTWNVFYANANIDTVSFATDFTIRLLVSEDPHMGWSPAPATYTAQSSTVEASGVPAPDYFIDATSLAIQVDANWVVTAVSGHTQIHEHETAAQAYAIYDGMVFWWEVEDIEAAWDSARIKGDVAELPLLRLDAEQFDLLGQHLPVHRTVMFRNSQEGVSSYQVHTLEFSPGWH